MEIKKVPSGYPCKPSSLAIPQSFPAEQESSGALEPEGEDVILSRANSCQDVILSRASSPQSPCHDTVGIAKPTPDSQRTGKSPRAFRSLAKSIFGVGRFLSVHEESHRNVDVQGIVQRIAVTLTNLETFKKVALNVFSKFSVEVELPDGSVERQMPTAQLKGALAHWQIPEENVGIFWAMLRKQALHWDMRVLPQTISLEDFQACLVKVLRRIRDRYCEVKVRKNSFVTQNRRQLEEEYLTSDSCGKGSFGECMFVTHRMSKRRRVCKKILKAEANVPSEEVELELDTLRRLDHPNIVRVYEWFESDTAYLLVLEAADGGDLKKLLSSMKEHRPEDGPRSEHTNRGLEEGLACTLMKQALKALTYIHSMMVIHRDIKPANMLLATVDLEKAHLLLADFGVAELFEEHGKMQSVVRGTVAYMAPEVFQSEVSPRSDIWALGIVTYELLCGERPFTASNPMAMYAQLHKTEVKYDKVVSAGASQSAVSFMGRLLNKDEPSRPSAADALDDPWFSDNPLRGPPQGRQLRQIRKSLESYMGRGHFTKIAMNCIAAQLDTAHLEDLTTIFQSMDLDNNGTLSPAELAVGLAELGVEPDAIGQLVDSMDFNHNGHIDYSEFVASLLKTQGQLIEDVLFHAFNIFDINHDGSICLEELQAMLSGDGPLTAVLPDGKTVEEVLHEVDTSRDGLISFTEFRNYLSRDGQVAHPAAALTDDAVDHFFDASESLDIVFKRLAPELGRSEAELEGQARRLKEIHWLSTVGDIQELGEDEWRRLGLPLKLERKLRAHMR